MRLAPDNRIGDYLHTNSIRFVTEELASVHPYAKTGQILINVRNFPLIALIDRNTRKVEWALTGPWVGQHDAEMLPNGNMLIFDNRGNIKPGQQESRIIEFNPMTQEVVWEYGGNKAEPFASSWRSAQQRLPNNNTLITESNYGRLLEVTSAGEIVWEYRNPVRGGDNNEYVAVICQAKRIAANELRFLQ
jgi:hypothetical protein